MCIRDRAPGCRGAVPLTTCQLTVIVAARNEADRIGATLAALREALPEAALWVADDASGDGTAEVAMVAGAQVVSRGRPHGKGANVTAADHLRPGDHRH